MKIENEITGHVKIHTSSKLQIELWIKDEQVDFFTLDLEAETVEIHVEKSTGVLLGMRGVYEGYIKLIADLGLEIPEIYKKHWTPTLKDGTLWCYFVNSVGGIDGISFSNRTFDNELVANFNIFPNKELAEKAANLSKLERLILLWQYANDCLFEPVWNNKRSRKHYFYYSHNLERILVGDYFDFQDDILYFETEEQTKAFVDMYSEEIKKSMGVR